MKREIFEVRKINENGEMNSDEELSNASKMRAFNVARRLSMRNKGVEYAVLCYRLNGDEYEFFYDYIVKNGKWGVEITNN